MLAIGHPSNGKTPGETVHLKVDYFLTGLMDTYLRNVVRRYFDGAGCWFRRLPRTWCKDVCHHPAEQLPMGMKRRECAGLAAGPGHCSGHGTGRDPRICLYRRSAGHRDTSLGVVVTMKGSCQPSARPPVPLFGRGHVFWRGRDA